MGFNKRTIEKEILFKYIESSKPIKPLYKADAFIFMDKLSSDVFDWFYSGMSEEEVVKKIKQYRNENN
jgi:hypothetical protein